MSVAGTFMGMVVGEQYTCRPWTTTRFGAYGFVSSLILSCGLTQSVKYICKLFDFRKRKYIETFMLMLRQSYEKH